MKKRSVLTVLAFVLSAVPAYAETLSEVIRDTLNSNPELAAQRATLRSVSAQKGQATAGYKPTIALVGDAGLEHREYEMTDIPDKIKDNAVPYSYGVQAGINLYEGGKTMYASKAAQFREKAEQNALRAKEVDLTAQTATAYLDYLDTVNVQTLQKNNLSVMRAHFIETRDKAKLGRGTATDVAQAQARLEGAKALLTQADMNVNNAVEYYFRITGKTPEYDKTLNISAIVQGAPKSKADSDVWNLIKNVPATLQEAEKTAEENNPLLKELTERENAAAQNVKIAKNTAYPTLDLTAYAGRQEDQIMMDYLTNYQAKLSLKVPLYDASVAHYKSAEALERKNAVRFQKDNAGAVVKQAVRSAWNEIQTRRSEINYARTQIRANKKALDGVIDEARNGSRTTLDVLNAQQELLDSEVTLSHAQYGLIKARISLLQALGTLKI